MVSSALKYRVKTERQRASKRKDIRKEWEQKEGMVFVSFVKMRLMKKK